MKEIINSKRLILRKVVEEDWLIVYQSIKSPNFPDDLPLKERILSENDAKHWVGQSINSWNEFHRYNWTICLRDNKNAIGQISLTKNSTNHRWVVAFWVSDKFQNLGYAKEALMAITTLRDPEDTMLKLWAGAAKWNKASNSVLSKCGFEKIGENENGYVYKGIMIPINEYEKV